MDINEIKTKYCDILSSNEIISFLGHRVLFFNSAIEHAFYLCPKNCPGFVHSNKSYKHCQKSKDNCANKIVSIERVNNMQLIKDVLTGNVEGRIEVYRDKKGETKSDYIYIYAVGPPYFLIVCYPIRKGKQYAFKTAHNISEKKYRQNICSLDLFDFKN